MREVRQTVDVGVGKTVVVHTVVVTRHLVPAELAAFDLMSEGIGV